MVEIQRFSWAFFTLALGVLVGIVILVVERPRSWIEALIYYGSVLAFAILMTTALAVLTYTLLGGK